MLRADVHKSTQVIIVFEERQRQQLIRMGLLTPAEGRKTLPAPSAKIVRKAESKAALKTHDVFKKNRRSHLESFSVSKKTRFAGTKAAMNAETLVRSAIQSSKRSDEIEKLLSHKAKAPRCPMCNQPHGLTHLSNCPSNKPANDKTPPITQLGFKLLAADGYFWGQVVDYWSNPALYSELQTEPLCLERQRFVKRLRPVRAYLGILGWKGYVAFEFSTTKKILLESLPLNNAAYVICGANWLALAGLSKQKLRGNFGDRVQYKVHSGDWEPELKRMLT